jgi:TatD DNase family protein
MNEYMLIDTHCHLDFSQFDSDREKVIQRAIKNKVNLIITIGTNLYSSQKAIELAEKFAVIYAAIGIHPNDCIRLEEDDFNQIKELSSHNKVVALGEIGLDYYRMNIPIKKQQDIFRIQLQLAHSLKLPVIIHNRDAHDDIYKILMEENAAETSGVLHSFTGDVSFLESILALSFYVSFTGSVTFKNSNYENILAKVPLERLLLETDSPFLTPVPFRGKRNEPAYIRYIAEKIAQIKKISVGELAKVTSENAKRLFSKIK